MSTGGVGDELRLALRKLPLALDRGDWPWILYRCPVVAGSAYLVRVLVLCRMVARSMELQARGDVRGAWDLLGEAVRGLPSGMRQPVRAGATPRAALLSEPPDVGPYEELAWRVARVIWREQYELDELRRCFAPGRMSARTELAHACIQFYMWIWEDPFVFGPPALPRPSESEPLPVDPTRSALCRRGTCLRQFADPRAGDISQSPWRDVGACHGLCVEAWRELATWPAPAPWCGVADLPVRFGRLRAWERAHQRNDDRDY